MKHKVFGNIYCFLCLGNTEGSLEIWSKPKYYFQKHIKPILSVQNKCFFKFANLDKTGLSLFHYYDSACTNIIEGLTFKPWLLLQSRHFFFKIRKNKPQFVVWGESELPCKFGFFTFKPIRFMHTIVVRRGWKVYKLVRPPYQKNGRIVHKLKNLNDPSRK